MRDGSRRSPFVDEFVVFENPNWSADTINTNGKGFSGIAPFKISISDALKCMSAAFTCWGN